jgi:hypothetical protein
MTPGPVAATQTFSAFMDTLAENPIGVLIRQETFSYAPPDDGFVIIRYVLENTTAGTVAGLYFGLMTDWDIPNYAANAGGYDATDSLAWTAYRSGATNLDYRAVKLLEGPLAGVETRPSPLVVYIKFWGGDGYTDAEKWNSLTDGFTTASTYIDATSDLYQVISAGPYTLAPGGADTATFAIIGGDTWTELTDNADRASTVPTFDCCGRYTSGFTGNTNCGDDGKRNLGDITTLVDRVYVTKTPLCCEANGNVNGDIEDKINLADIVRLVDHIYVTKVETEPCE